MVASKAAELISQAFAKSCRSNSNRHNIFPSTSLIVHTFVTVVTESFPGRTGLQAVLPSANYYAESPVLLAYMYIISNGTVYKRTN